MSNVIDELLNEHAQINQAIRELQLRKKNIAEVLTLEVETTGAPITGAGWRAYMVEGRANVNHEKAAIDAGVSFEIVKRHTVQPPLRVAWAKVTKEARLNLAEYTTRGKPSLKIEPVQS